MDRAYLEACGIKAFILDDQTITADWLYSNAIGGVKLQVFENQADEALELLSAEESSPLPDESFLDTALRCPRCSSLKVRSAGRIGRRLSAFLFLLGFPSSRSAEGYRCADCGHRW